MRSSASVATLLCIVAVNGLPASEQASGGQSQIVYDDEHGSIVVTAPPGWAFDVGGPRDEGLRTVVYPVGMTPTNASAAIYIRTAGKQPGTGLDAFIRADAERWRARGAGVQIVSGQSLPTARSEIAPLRHVSSSTGFDSVAYLEAPAVYITITLTSKTKTAHEESQPALAALVKSYHVSTVKGAIRR